MSKSRKTPLKQRAHAFLMQNGFCYYCKSPMWFESPVPFAISNKVSVERVSPFQCTAEHLKPFSEGGSSEQTNIVAACKYCNQQRHRQKNVRSPVNFRNFVQIRIRKGHWNSNFLS